jgi:hypothetical protein
LTGHVVVATGQHGTAKSVHWNIPRTINNLFTGRTEVLDKIKDSLRRSNNTLSTEQQKRFIITGLGGQGKSEICLKVADELRQEYVTSVILNSMPLLLLIMTVSGVSSGSMLAMSILLKVILLLLQRHSDPQLRALMRHDKYLQTSTKAGFSSWTTLMRKNLITRGTSHLEPVALSS